MDIDEALFTRRTAHLWADEPVPLEVVEKGIQAAQMAPCHRLTWPWRFALAGPETEEPGAPPDRKPTPRRQPRNSARELRSRVRCDSKPGIVDSWCWLRHEVVDRWIDDPR